MQSTLTQVCTVTLGRMSLRSVRDIDAHTLFLLHTLVSHYGHSVHSHMSVHTIGKIRGVSLRDIDVCLSDLYSLAV